MINPIKVDLKPGGPLVGDCIWYIQDNDDRNWRFSEPGCIFRVSETEMSSLLIHQTSGEDHYV